MNTQQIDPSRFFSITYTTREDCNTRLSQDFYPTIHEGSQAFAKQLKNKIDELKAAGFIAFASAWNDLGE